MGTKTSGALIALRSAIVCIAFFPSTSTSMVALRPNQLLASVGPADRDRTDNCRRSSDDVRAKFRGLARPLLYSHQFFPLKKRSKHRPRFWQDPLCAAVRWN